MRPANSNSIFLDDCSTDELLELISQLDNNKSSDIPIRVIKKAAHIISPHLASYFNVCMAEGHFPDILKVGKVTPIFKKVMLKTLETTDLYQLFPYSGNSLKRSYIVEYIKLLYLKTSLIRINLVSGNPTPPAMQSTYQLK